MRKFTWEQIVAGLLLAWPIGKGILRSLGILGDVDTVCTIAGVDDALECGSAAVIQFLINPPDWLMSLCVIAGIILLFRAERKRNRFLQAEAEEKLTRVSDEARAFLTDTRAQMHALQQDIRSLPQRIQKDLHATEAIAREARYEHLVSVEKTFREDMRQLSDKLQARLDENMVRLDSKIVALDRRTALIETTEPMATSLAEYDQPQSPEDTGSKTPQ